MINQPESKNNPTIIGNLIVDLDIQRIPFCDLPVIAHVDQIAQSILTRKNQVVIVIAETGAGKSTVIPWTMARMHGKKTWVTEPRRVAAQSLAGYVSLKDNTELGDKIGVKTAIHSNISSNTDLLYATDGWVLAVTLARSKNDTKVCDVLILDEAHEENKNLYLLLGLWKKWSFQGKQLPQLVVMSATIQQEKYKNYLNNPPIFEIPGRTFHVEKLWEPTKQIEDVIKEQVKLGRDCMVFLPGKYEIEEMQERLSAERIDAEILPLHREIEWPRQQEVFKKFPRPKVILSTDIGQTSITPDAHVVISSGIKRRTVIFDGIQRLCDVLCSNFDIEQQFGRVGRNEDGLAILCSPVPFHDSEKLSPEVRISIRSYKGKPRELKERAQIHTTRLEMDWLKLKKAGESLKHLNPYLPEQISESRLQETENRLKLFGAITPEGGITTTGDELIKYPCQIESAEIIRRSKRCEELGIAVAAILEVGGILNFQRGMSAAKQSWYTHYGDEKKSDLIGQLNVFLCVLNKVVNKDSSLTGLHLLRALEDEGEKMGLKKRKVGLLIDTIEMLGKYKNTSGHDSQWVFESLKELCKSSGQDQVRIQGQTRTYLMNAIAFGLREYMFLPLENRDNIKMLTRVSGQKDSTDIDVEYVIHSNNPIVPKPHDVVLAVPFQLERNGRVRAQLSGALCLSRKELEGIGLKAPDLVSRGKNQSQQRNRGNSRWPSNRTKTRRKKF